MSTIDNQLAELLVLNAGISRKTDVILDGNVMLLAGKADDPDSFNAQGGKSGELGYYPVENVSGQITYRPCLERIQATAKGSQVLTVAALATVSPALRPTATLTEGGRAGTFYWDDADRSAEVASDPAKGMYVAPDFDPTGAQGAWVRMPGVRTDIDVRWFGADNTGVANSSTAVQAACNFAALKKRLVYAPDGRYRIDNLVTVPAGVELRGAGLTASEFFGGDATGILAIGAGSGATVGDLALHTTRSTYGGLVIFHQDVSNLLVERIKFTDAGFSNNGIKFVFDNATVGLSRATVRGCWFFNNGRMGAEVQNHRGDGVVRYRDVTFEANIVTGSGAINAAAGMGISLSGPGLNCTVDFNIFKGNRGPCIELIGPSKTDVTRNVFDSVLARPIQCANANIMTGVRILNNRTIGDPARGSVYLNSLVNAVVEGNEFTFGTNPSTGAGYSVEIYSTGLIFRRNTVVAPSVSPIYLFNAVACQITDNDVASTLESFVGGSMVALRGSLTSRNIVTNNRFRKAAGGNWTSEGNGAGGNIRYPNFTDDGATLAQDVAPATSFVVPAPKLTGTLQLLSTAAFLAAGNFIDLDTAYAGIVPGITIRCEKVAGSGGQPNVRFIYAWGGRLNNEARMGEIHIVFSSFNDPTAAPKVIQQPWGDLATVTTPLENGKRYVRIALPVGASSVQSGELLVRAGGITTTDTDAAFAAYSVCSGGNAA